MLNAGAQALQIYTSFIYQGTKLVRNFDRRDKIKTTLIDSKKCDNFIAFCLPVRFTVVSASKMEREVMNKLILLIGGLLLSLPICLRRRHQRGRYRLDHDRDSPSAVGDVARTVAFLWRLGAFQERAQRADAVFYHCLRDVTVVAAGGLFAGLYDGGSLNAFIGGLDNVLLAQIGEDTESGTIPESVFALFQMTFAVITPALIVGGFAERMRFSAVVLFSSAWLILVYAPICHWVWGGGWLSDLGVMDFVGGIVVHYRRCCCSGCGHGAGQS